MKQLWDLAYKTEKSNIEKNEYICKLVINQLEQIIKFKFNLNIGNGYKMTYLNAITTILLSPSYSCYRNILIELLKQYNLNERGMLFHMLGVINQYKASTEAREKLITAFMKLPYYESANWNEKMMNIKTKYGKIRINRYHKIIENPKIYNMITTTKLHNKCHEAVEITHELYPEHYIVTGEIPLLFEGYMYHSYFSSDEGTTDIANNLFYKENDFNLLYEPTEILKIKTTEFIENLEELSKEKNIKNDKMTPVLALALNNKRKNISFY